MDNLKVCCSCGWETPIITASSFCGGSLRTEGGKCYELESFKSDQLSFCVSEIVTVDFRDCKVALKYLESQRERACSIEYFDTMAEAVAHVYASPVVVMELPVAQRGPYFVMQD